MALSVGGRLGHFEILAPLGAGGMGVVYCARDTRLGRDVALKVLPEAFARDSGRLARFEREAHVLATLSHPGIAAIYGLEPGEDGPVLVMELVEGEGLDKRLARGRIPVRQVLESDRGSHARGRAGSSPRAVRRMGQPHGFGLVSRRSRGLVHRHEGGALSSPVAARRDAGREGEDAAATRLQPRAVGRVARRPGARAAREPDDGDAGLLEGDAGERDLTWFDRTSAVQLGPDGRTLVFGEAGETGGALGTTYLWRVGQAPPVRLAEGVPTSQSQDGAWVISIATRPDGGKELHLVPTGPGEPCVLARGTVEPFGARFFPDAKRIVVMGTEPGRPRTVFVQDLPDGTPRRLLPEAWLGGPPTPDGRFVPLRPSMDGVAVLQPVDGGEPRPIPGLRAAELILGYSADGTSAFLSPNRYPDICPVTRLGMKTGQRSLWRDVRPPDPTGLVDIMKVSVHPNGRYYAYSYERYLSDLYMIEGLK